jgi:phosphoglucomutase
MQPEPLAESEMAAEVSPLAGKTAPASMLVNVPRLVTAYFSGRPDPAVPSQRVAFGTSGHRGSAFNNAFNEAHILAISQAICEHRRGARITGPLFIGIDTHALSIPALASALEVFAANGVTTMIDAHDGYTPTPVISHAILTTNRNRSGSLADGVAITPSHNPPEDGGFKYKIFGASGGCRSSARVDQPACTATITSDPMSPTSRMSSTWRRSAHRA